nr:putative pentatricopeptide repeat-containing protein At1g12700, mitochondrial [Coffea arabica]
MMLKRRAFGSIVSISMFQKESAEIGTATSTCTAATFLLPNPYSKPILSFHSAADAMDSPPVVLTNLINNDINNLEEALFLYNDMVRSRPVPYVFHFNQLLSRIVKMKHYSPAICVFKDMYFLSIQVDDYTLNTVINCYCLLNRVDLGFCILGVFFKYGIVPDVTTFNTLLRGLFRQHMVPRAQELFGKIICEKLCEPNGVMFGTVINGLCKAGNTGKAVEFLRVMGKEERVKPTTIIYSTIIDSLCKDKMVDKTLDLLHEMVEKGIAPDVVTYNCLIQGLCKFGRWKEVTKLLIEMNDFHIVRDVFTFGIVIDALCKEGEVEAAEDVFQTMLKQGERPSCMTYGALMDGYCL